MPDDNKGQRVTDPNVLAALESAAAKPVRTSAKEEAVTDPNILAALEGGSGGMQAKSTTVQTPAATVQKTTVEAEAPAEEPFIGITPARKEQRSAFEQKLAPEIKPVAEVRPQQQPRAAAAGAQLPEATNVTTETGEVIINQPQAPQVPKEKGKDVMRSDMEQTIANLPDWAKGGFKQLGVDPNAFINRAVDNRATQEELKQYMKIRNQMLEAKHQQDIDALENEFPSTVEGAGTEAQRVVRADQAGYDARVRAIDKQNNAEKDRIAKAAYATAAEKGVADMVRKNVDPMTINPLLFGIEMDRAMTGNDEENDRTKRLIDKGIALDPTKKVNLEMKGYQALNLVYQDAVESGNQPLANWLRPVVENYQDRVRQRNPEYVKSAMAGVLRNQIAKDESSLWDSFIGVQVDQDKMNKAAASVGWTQEDIKGITPEDVRDVPGAARKALTGFMNASINPASEMLWRHTPLQNAAISAGLVDKDEQDEFFSTNWYDKAGVNKALLSGDIASRQLIEGGQKVQTNKRDKDFLMNVSNENAGNFNINGATLGDAAFAGAGQVYGLGATGKAASAVLRGAKLINGLKAAQEGGFMLGNIITSYDQNLRDTYADIPADTPNAEALRVGNAWFRTGMQVLSERILPDYKFLDMIQTPTGRSLIRDISEKGLSVLGDKQNITQLLRKMAGETTGRIVSEAAEGQIETLGNAMGDFFLAPQKFAETDYGKEVLQSGLLNAAGAIIPSAAGTIAKARGPMAKSLLYDVGNNPAMYKESINKDIQSGAITQEQGNAQIKTVNTLANIVNNSVPEVSVINNQKLTDKQKHDYTDLRLQESIINEKKTQVSDPVQSKYFDQQLADIQKQKEAILSTAGIQTPAQQQAMVQSVTAQAVTDAGVALDVQEQEAQQREQERQQRAEATQQARGAERKRQERLNAEANAKAEAEARGETYVPGTATAALDQAEAAAAQQAAQQQAAQPAVEAVDNAGFEEVDEEGNPIAPEAAAQPAAEVTATQVTAAAPEADPIIQYPFKDIAAKAHWMFLPFEMRASEIDGYVQGKLADPNVSEENKQLLRGWLDNWQQQQAAPATEVAATEATVAEPGRADFILQGLEGRTDQNQGVIDQGVRDFMADPNTTDADRQKVNDYLSANNIQITGVEPPAPRRIDWMMQALENRNYIGMDQPMLDAWIQDFMADPEVNDADRKRVTDYLNANNVQFTPAPEVTPTSQALTTSQQAAQNAQIAQEQQAAQQPEAEAVPEVAPAPEDVITVGEMMGQPVMYKGRRGTIAQDGQTVIVKMADGRREIELGNADEISAMSIKDFDGLEQQTNVVSINADNNNIVVRGAEFTNTNTDPSAAVRRDADGNVQSVTLQAADGQNRTFRGDVAEDIAYQIALQKLARDGNRAFEGYLNRADNTAVQQEMDNERLSEASERKTTSRDKRVRKGASRRQRKGTTPKKQPEVPRPRTEAAAGTEATATIAAAELGQPEPGVAAKPERVEERGTEIKRLDYTTKDGKYRITDFDPKPTYVVIDKKTGRPKINKRTGQPLVKRSKPRPGLYVTNAAGEKITGMPYRAAIRQAAMEHDFTSGEYGDPMNEDEALANKMSYEDYILAQVKATANPIELIRLLEESSKSFESLPVLSHRDQVIGEQVVGGEYDIRAFHPYFGFGEDHEGFKRNYPDLYKSYVAKKGEKGRWLDQDAFYMDEQTGGEVDPQELIDFMERFPKSKDAITALEQQKNPVVEEIKNKFERITGFPLTDDIIDIAIRQENEEGMTPEEQALINKHYETRSDFEEEFNRAVAEGRVVVQTEDGNLPGATAQRTDEAAQGAGEATGRPFELDTTKPLAEQLADLKGRTDEIKARLDELRSLKKGDPEFSRREQEQKTLRREHTKLRRKQNKVAGKILADEWRSKKRAEKDTGGLRVQRAGAGISDTKIFNAAIEIAAKAIEAGYSIRSAVQDAVDFVKNNWHTAWDEADFRDNVLGENLPTPLTPDELRGRMEGKMKLGVKNKAVADQMIADVNSGTKTLADVLDQINRTGLSPALKQKISNYIRDGVAQNTRDTGDTLANSALTANNGDYNLALQQIRDDRVTEMAAATDEAQRQRIDERYTKAESVLEREQVKQKLLDGTIDPVDQFGNRKPKPANFTVAPLTKAQRLEQKGVDKYLRLSKIQAALPVKVKDVVAQYRLARSRGFHKIQGVRKFLGDSVHEKGTLFGDLKDAGITLKQFSTYLYAKHAPERNAKNAADRQAIYDDKVDQLKQQIKHGTTQEAKDNAQRELDKIYRQEDPKYLLMPDGGSGMTNEQAQQVMDEIRADGKLADYERFGQQFKEKVIDKILDYKHESGIISDEEYNRLKNGYQNYIPLKFDLDAEIRGDDTGTLADTGMSGRQIFRSTGAAQVGYEKRNHALIQAMVDLDYSILKGEENKANQELARAIEANPNDAVWSVRPAQYATGKDSKGNVVFGDEINRPTKNAVAYWENGKKKYIIINDPDLQQAIEKIGVIPGMRFLQGVTSLIRTTATLRNPEFILTNPLLDLQDAFATLKGEKGAAQVVENYKKNLGVKLGMLPTNYPKIISQIASGKGEWAQVAEEWAAEGGKVPFHKQTSLKETGKDLEKSFEKYETGPIKKRWNKAIDLFDKGSDVLETATRIVVYKSARDAGMSKEQSAILSRDATIDFEKSGTHGSYINAWKAFGNASLQASVGFGKSLVKSKALQKTALAMVGAGIAQAFMNDMFYDCEDDPQNCYWELPEHKKAKSFVVPSPWGIATIPIGRKLGWFNYLGQQMYSAAQYVNTDGEKGIDPATTIANSVTSLIDYYNVTGTAPFWQQIAGNYGPIVGLWENKNAFGGEIRPENKKELPEHMSYKANTPKFFVGAADVLSRVTGGGDAETGLIEVSPNTLKYIAESLTTGVGALGGRIWNLVAKPLEGEEISAKDIPVAHKFGGETGMAATKEKVGVLTKRAATDGLTNEEYGQLNDYINNLVDEGEWSQSQRGKTLKYVSQKQKQLGKLRYTEEKKDEE